MGLEVENCTFSHNTAEHEGGALSAMSGTLQITDCQFVENVAAKGGAVAAVDYGDLYFESCIFSGNSADDGGAIYLENDALVTARQCTFAYNQATRGACLSIVSSDMDTSAVENSIFAFGIEGEGIYWDGSGGLELSCCDIFGNEGGDWVGLIADQSEINGNLEEDPVFCGDLNPDEPLTLAVESPCAPGNNPDCGLIGALPVGCPQTGIEESLPSRSVITLLQNSPNPFHPPTTICFELARPARVELRIHDLSSRLVRSLIDGSLLPAGHHEVVWKGRNDVGRQVAAGVYYYRLEAGSSEQTKRLTLIR